MTTIGYATLQIIPSLKGVSEAIEQQIDGKVVAVTIEPNVDERATERAGRKAREGVEKHTKEVAVEPKVDERAAEDAGRKTGEAVTRGASGSSSALGQAILGALQGAGEDAGRRLGEKLSESIPTGMTGAAKRIGDALRNSLPAAGSAAGMALATAIGIALTDAIGKERLDRAGKAVMGALTKAVKAANTSTDIGVAIGNSVAGGLNAASGAISGAASKITDTIGGIASGVDAAKQLLGGDNSWAAPGLDTLNGALGKVAPLLEGMNGAATLASAGAQAISVATGVASKAQLLWNAALIANPIGLIVAAIAAVVAGLVLFFTKTELGRKIWAGFTEYLKVAWEGIKTAFSMAWDVISGIWDGMVTGAKLVWSGIKNEFTAMVNFVKGLPGMISAAASGLWEGLKSGLVAVLNWIGDKWNSFAETLSVDLPGTALDVTIPKMPRFTFGGGGYTGDVPPDQVAGVVHGGEHVIKSDSRRRIENAYPGLLDYLNNNGALPGYAGGGLVAGAAQLRSIISEKFGISNIGGWRPADKYGEHSTGRALDVMTSSKATGDAVKNFAVDNASAIDLKWVIWQQRLWYPGGTSKAMEDRGNPTQNHMDHVHIFSGTGITNGLQGVLKGGADSAAAGASGVRRAAVADPSGVSAPDQTPAMAGVTPDHTSAAAGGGKSSFALADSFSGLAGMGGKQLGALSPVVSPDGKTESLDGIGSAVGEFAAGQVSSALGVAGVNGSPGWLKGLSTFVSGMSFGSSGGGPLGGDSASAAPLAAAPPALATAMTPDIAHGSSAGQRPGPVFNTTIQARDAEGAMDLWKRQQAEMTAAKLSRYY